MGSLPPRPECCMEQHGPQKRVFLEFGLGERPFTPISARHTPACGTPKAHWRHPPHLNWIIVAEGDQPHVTAGGQARIGTPHRWTTIWHRRPAKWVVAHTQNESEAPRTSRRGRHAARFPQCIRHTQTPRVSDTAGSNIPHGWEPPSHISTNQWSWPTHLEARPSQPLMACCKAIGSGQKGSVRRGSVKNWTGFFPGFSPGRYVSGTSPVRHDITRSPTFCVLSTFSNRFFPGFNRVFSGF